MRGHRRGRRHTPPFRWCATRAAPHPAVMTPPPSRRLRLRHRTHTAGAPHLPWGSQRRGRRAATRQRSPRARSPHLPSSSPRCRCPGSTWQRPRSSGPPPRSTRRAQAPLPILWRRQPRGVGCWRPGACWAPSWRACRGNAWARRHCSTSSSRRPPWAAPGAATQRSSPAARRQAEEAGVPGPASRPRCRCRRCPRLTPGACRRLRWRSLPHHVTLGMATHRSAPPVHAPRTLGAAGSPRSTKGWAGWAGGRQRWPAGPPRMRTSSPTPPWQQQRTTPTPQGVPPPAFASKLCGPCAIKGDKTMQGLAAPAQVWWVRRACARAAGRVGVVLAPRARERVPGAELRGAQAPAQGRAQHTAVAAATTTTGGGGRRSRLAAARGAGGH